MKVEVSFSEKEVLVRVDENEKTIPRWKFEMGLKRALYNSPIKIRFGDEIVEVPAEEIINAAKPHIVREFFSKEEVTELACAILLHSEVFEHVLDGMDRRNYTLSMHLEREEFIAIKNYLEYDGDVEGWVFKDPNQAVEAVLKLLTSSERFRALFIWTMIYKLWKPFFSDAIRAVKNWNYYKRVVIPTSKEDIKEFEKLQFTPLRREPSLSGFLLDSLEVAEYKGVYVYRWGQPVPPDDYVELYFASREPLKLSKAGPEVVVFEEMLRVYNVFKDVKLPQTLEELPKIEE